MLDIAKTIALVLVLIATINLGLMGLMDLDLIGKIFGTMPILLKIFHILVGLSGVMLLLAHLKK